LRLPQTAEEAQQGIAAAMDTGAERRHGRESTPAVCDTVDLLKTFHLTLHEAVQDRSDRLRIGLCLTYVT
jgi:hypothetical protein